jgi:hypothetical protein
VSQPVEILCQRGSQLLLTDNALLEDQFLHRRQAVAEVGDAHLQARNPVIFRAALFDALRAFNTVVNQGRAIGLGGRDLSAEVGGISALTALEILAGGGIFLPAVAF